MDNYLPDDPLLFARLLIGLEAASEQFEKGNYYPYPTTLCIAWNALSLRLLAGGKRPAPATLEGLLALCTRPVGEWFPAAVPPSFPPELPLLHRGGGIALFGPASAFLAEGVYRAENIRNLAGAAGIERALQNHQFVEMIGRLKNAKNSDAAQKEYVFLRRFLITKPFVTQSEITSAFALNRLVTSGEVGNFYRDCKMDETYRCCPNCGPLRRDGGRWRGAKAYGQNADKGLRMLAVGTKNAPLTYPTEAQIVVVMRLWLMHWGNRPWLQNIITSGPGKHEWDKLTAAFALPPDTKWETKDPQDLLQKNDGLIYDVVPSLVATLLHETKSLIVTGPHQKEVRWRRMQDGGAGRYAVVSYPLPVEFLKENPPKKGETGKTMSEKSGYFSYKIEISLQTQAGRTEPWLYLSLHCMRYAHLPLVYNQRGNDITVLVGANQARLQGWETDTTLIRMKSNPNVGTKSSDKILWLEDLPSLLADIKARALVKPDELYKAPCRYWFDGEACPTDEYYLLHTEGYKYKGINRQEKQAVLTGFGLMERAQVLGSLCDGPLCAVLVPDAPMRPDAKPTGSDAPTLMTFADLMPDIALEAVSSDEKNAPDEATKNALKEARTTRRDDKESKLRQEKQPIVNAALVRALNGKRLIIARFFREAHTHELLHDQLREAFLLNNGDPFPPSVVVLPPVFVEDEAMVKPLLEEKNTKRSADEIRNWHGTSLNKWRDLLKETFADYANQSDVVCAAIVELDESTHKKTAVQSVPERRSIHRVIREACCRENVLSQMIITPKKLINNAKIDSAPKAIALNVVQEIVVRQTGGLYEPPCALYQKIGLEAFVPVASELDVIALSFVSTQNGAAFCLATRLRADGTVSVLLPNENGKGEPEAKWRPYAEAGAALGLRFASAQGDVNGYGKINNGKQGGEKSKARLNAYQINTFVEKLLIEKLERPTVVIVEAEKWRSVHNNGGNWWQLQNPKMLPHEHRLIFGSSYKEAEQRIYERDEGGKGTHEHLIGVVRLRATETPQYITNRADWQFDDADLMRNYVDLTGFIDQTTQSVFHYFSVGKLSLGAAQPQHRKTLPDPYKIVSGGNSGGGVAYKHPAMIEMVPFFVHPAFNSPAGKAALCRIPHYLRVSPVWNMASLDSPYPLHLGDTLINDHLCILGLGER